MGALIPNIAKGKFAYLAGLPATNDGLVWVLLKAAGLEADAVLLDYDNLAAILAASNDEASFAGYARVAATGPAVTVDDTNNRVDADANNPSWSPTSAEALGKVILCYDPDVGTGTDADLVPLFADDFALTTPTSGTIDYNLNAAGFGRAS
jgi:hypothetical protein